MIREHVELRHPAEVEPAKWRTHRFHQSTAGFIHSGPSGSDEVLCRAGIGMSNSSDGSEVKLPTPPPKPCYRLLKSAIEREVEWGVGITRLGGVKTKFVRFIRADGKVARGGNDVLSCTRGCYCCCVASRLKLVGSARATTKRTRTAARILWGRGQHTTAAADTQTVCARVRTASAGGGATGMVRVTVTPADCNWARTQCGARTISWSYLISED